MSSTDDTVKTERLFDGRYRILRRLGHGGMATVYLAEDVSLHRKVAIKVLSDRYSQDDQFVERFAREARAAAGLNHPNIVQVYDRGESGGSYYIAMEYVEGESLKDLIVRDAPLPVRRAIDLTLQILAALRNSHRNGVVHRDVKPHNIMVPPDGRVKVTDFGIARAGVSQMTEAGSIIGTAQYLSPEQARGLRVGPPADLYSVGVVLYEMLTGQVPFEGESAVAIAMRHVSEPPVPPSELNPRVTPDLERVVLRALAKAPEDRYATADEMGIDLDRVRKGLPVAGVGTATAATRPLARPATETMVAPVPAAPAYAGNGPVAYSDAAGRPAKRRLWPWLLLLAIVALSAGLAYAAVNALDGGEDDAATTATTPTTAPVERVAVPALGGKSFDEASRLLAARGLRAERRNTFEERPAGTVIGQSPRARTQVERDSVVVLTVSRGPRPVAVPGVTGQSEQAATQALTQAGFKVAVRREASEEVPEGQVIRQEPAAQAQSTAGATVTLVVSSGSSRVEVPNVVNATEGEARQRLADAGLKVGRVTRQPSEGVERGRVIESRPGATERVAPGSAVELVVSGGPEEVTVPSVVGETEQAARARLRAQGFEVEVERVDTDDQTQDGVVQEQDPPAEAAATERRVTIVVGRFKQP